MTAPAAAPVLSALSNYLRPRGLDVISAFRVSWYNSHIESLGLPVKPLGSFGRKDAGAVIIGNSKAIWEPFVKAIVDDSALLNCSDPLDTYTQRSITQALGQDDLKVFKSDCFYSCDTGDRLVAMQRIAHMIGMAQLDENTHLSVHPTFGPWIGLRAVVVLDVDGDGWTENDEPGPPIANLLSDAEISAAKQALQEALDHSNTAKLCEELHGAHKEKSETKASWKYWIKLREVVELGKANHRYGEDQAEYHYTKNLAVLKRAVQSAGES